MGALEIVVGDSSNDLGAGVVEIDEQTLSSRIRPLKLTTKPFCISFLGAMKC